MFEDSVSIIPSIWASVISWFTPTVLFVFLNLMIGTIVITSSLATQKGNNDQRNQQQLQYQHQHEQHAQRFGRSPSMLQRLKSINFYAPRSPEPNTNFVQSPGADTHFTSHYKYGEEPPQEQHQPPQWGRSPSMLQRLKSINLYSYMSQEATTPNKTQETGTHFYSNQVHEHEQEREREQEGERHHLEPEPEKEPEQGEEERKGKEDDHIQDQEQTIDEIYGKLKESQASRTKSDTVPASGEMPKKLPKKMKKSASSRSAFSHFKEEDIVEVEARRPATVKESGNSKITQVDDEEVDARADDFINKFKQQLKLQRIDSIIRYKETIHRGSG